MGSERDDSDRYSIPKGEVFLPRGGGRPSFDFPIGKGTGTAGFGYDPNDRLIDAELGYKHPIGTRGATFGVQGTFDKYIGPGGEQVAPNWGGALRFTLPFSHGGAAPGYANRGRVVDSLVKGVEGALSKIRTYTGSPYTFDKFDPAFIGKGEGSAAFGHGFYSAENPDVAQEYRRITGRKTDSPGGWERYGAQADDLRMNSILESLVENRLGYRPDDVTQLVKEISPKINLGWSGDKIDQAYRLSPGTAQRLIEGIESTGYQHKKPGWLYSLDLNAKPGEFFDWDAPVDANTWNRIHPNVQDELNRAVEDRGWNPLDAGEYKGHELFSGLMHHDVHDALPPDLGASSWTHGNTDPKQHTSAYLSEIGFPGIRYLDKGSRRAPQRIPYRVPENDERPGTRNYVMFPESADLIDIVNRQKAEGGRITPTPKIRGNLPRPREMPYPEGEGREVEPDLYTTQPWGAHPNTLPGMHDDPGTDVAERGALRKYRSGGHGEADDSANPLMPAAALKGVRFVTDLLSDLPSTVQTAVRRVLDHVNTTGKEAMITGRYGDNLVRPYTSKLVSGNEDSVAVTPAIKRNLRSTDPGQPYTIHPHPDMTGLGGYKIPWSNMPSDADVQSVYMPRSAFNLSGQKLPEMLIANQHGNLARFGGIHNAFDKDMRWGNRIDVAKHVKDILSQGSRYGKTKDEAAAIQTAMTDWAKAHGIVDFNPLMPVMHPTEKKLLTVMNPSALDLGATGAINRLDEMGIPVELQGNLSGHPSVPLGDAMKSWGNYLEGKTGETLGPQMSFDFSKAEGGQIPGYANKGRVVDDVVKTFNKYVDPATKFIKEWQWNPLSKVDEAIPGGIPKEVPDHVLSFGDFMHKMISKIGLEGLDPRDLLKAYTTTLASIQRQARDRSLLPDIKLSSDERMIRPEGAFADWLGGKHGQKYLDYGAEGEAHPDAIANAQQAMLSFGLHNKLADDLTAAPSRIAGQDARIGELVVRGGKGASDPSEWSDAVEQMRGIDAAKKGFLGAMLGYGDRPTFDARQIALHVPDPDEVSKFSRRQHGQGGEEAVARLAARQNAYNMFLPPEYEPLRQHMVHHTIWDAANETKTPHKDLIDMMLNRAEGGSIPEYAEGGAVLGYANRGRVVDDVVKLIEEGGKQIEPITRKLLESASGYSDAAVDSIRRLITKAPRTDASANISQIVPRSPYEHFTADYFNPSPLSPLATIRPEDFKDGRIIGAMGDRMGTNLDLYGINDQKFDRPVHLFGGPDYGRGPSGSFWASDKGPIGTYRNIAEQALEEGRQPYLTPMSMGRAAVDSTPEMTKTLLQMMQGAKIPNSAYTKFNEAMREFKLGADDPPLFGKSWPGLKSSRLEDWQLGLTISERQWLAKMMDKASFADLGFPDVAAARLALTSPEVLANPLMSSGRLFGRIDPSTATNKPSIIHPNYPAQIGGDLVGGFGRHVPVDVMFPTSYAERAARSKGSALQKSIVMGPLTEDVTPKWQDDVSKWLEWAESEGIPRAEGGRVSQEQTEEARRLAMIAKARRTRDDEQWRTDPHRYFDRQNNAPGYGWDRLKQLGVGALSTIPNQIGDLTEMANHYISDKIPYYTRDDVSNFMDRQGMAPAFEGSRYERETGANMGDFVGAMSALPFKTGKWLNALNRGFTRGTNTLGGLGIAGTFAGDEGPQYDDLGLNEAVRERGRFAEGGEVSDPLAGLPGISDKWLLDQIRKIIPKATDIYGNTPFDASLTQRDPALVKLLGSESSAAKATEATSGGSSGGIGDLLGGLGKMAGSLGSGASSSGVSAISPGAAMTAYNAAPASFTNPGFAKGGYLAPEDRRGRLRRPTIDDEMLGYGVMNAEFLPHPPAFAMGGSVPGFALGGMGMGAINKLINPTGADPLMKMVGGGDSGGGGFLSGMGTSNGANTGSGAASSGDSGSKGGLGGGLLASLLPGIGSLLNGGDIKQGLLGALLPGIGGGGLLGGLLGGGKEGGGGLFADGGMVCQPSDSGGGLGSMPWSSSMGGRMGEPPTQTGSMGGMGGGSIDEGTGGGMPPPGWGISHPPPSANVYPGPQQATPSNGPAMGGWASLLSGGGQRGGPLGSMGGGGQRGFGQGAGISPDSQFMYAGGGSVPRGALRYCGGGRY